MEQEPLPSKFQKPSDTHPRSTPARRRRNHASSSKPRSHQHTAHLKFVKTWRTYTEPTPVTSPLPTTPSIAGHCQRSTHRRWLRCRHTLLILQRLRPSTNRTRLEQNIRTSTTRPTRLTIPPTIRHIRILTAPSATRRLWTLALIRPRNNNVNSALHQRTETRTLWPVWEITIHHAEIVPE